MNKWRSIKTAPKDKRILGLFGTLPEDVKITHYCTIHSYWMNDEAGWHHEIDKPLKWQPLPAPPIAPEGKATEGEG